MQRVTPSSHDSKSRLRTVIAIKTISSRPYKIYVEVRRTGDRGKYSLTIASRDERKMYNIARALEKHRYRHKMYTDAYGFTRIHVKNLNYSNLSYILVMLKYWARESEEESEELQTIA